MMRRLKSSRMRRLSAAIVGLLAMLGCRNAVRPAVPRDPPGVLTIAPLERKVVNYETYTGRTEAKEEVEVRARVYGHLAKVHFGDGDLVQEGDLLYEIDSKTYAAVHAQNTAKIAAAKAKLDLAEKKLVSAKTLVTGGAVSKEQLDEAIAAREVGIADTALAEADAARSALDLEYTKIYSPITGQIDRTYVTQGNLIGGGLAGSTLLTRIVSIDPAYVYFDVDELSYRRYQERRPPNGDETPARLRDRKIAFRLALAKEEGYPRIGQIDFAQNRVDPGSGTMRVRGEVPNQDRKLTPGLFVRVQIPVSEPYDALLIPQRAIGLSQSLQFVFVVGSDNIARRRNVELGETRGSWRIIRKGLKKGEQVVVEGVQKLAEDDAVTARKANDDELPPLPPIDTLPELPTDATPEAIPEPKTEN